MLLNKDLAVSDFPAAQSEALKSKPDQKGPESV